MLYCTANSVFYYVIYIYRTTYFTRTGLYQIAIHKYLNTLFKFVIYCKTGNKKIFGDECILSVVTGTVLRNTAYANMVQYR